MENITAGYPMTYTAGGNGYISQIGGQEGLHKNCNFTGGRHNISTAQTLCMSNVFLRCTAKDDFLSVDTHQRDSTMLLLDNIILDNSRIDMLNRANATASHGETASNCVIWRPTIKTTTRISSVSGASLYLDNWSDGYCVGALGANPMTFMPRPASNRTELCLQEVTPTSLYEHQLAART
jgi:hypothetical protein